MASELSENGSENEQLPSPRVKLVRSDRAMPFSDYRMLGLVGQGQFAQVYCAVHKQTGQLAAIKQTRHASEQASQEPFVLNELYHPNIVCCRAIAETQSGYQFVLDYCEAGTLRSQMDFVVMSAAQADAQPHSLLSSIAVDVLKGLSYIHAQQVIHGDLKPENILLTYQLQSPSGKTSRLVARISDFGSARFVLMPSQSRKEIGSPTYAAPERFYGQSSYASDLYSAGVILYELLLGDRPFSGSPDSLRQAHQTQSVSFPKSLSLPIQKFLERSLHKHPNQRFSSADEMLSAFQSLSQTDIIAVVKVRAIAAEKSNLSMQSASAEPLKYSMEPLSVPKSENSRGKIHQLLTTANECWAMIDQVLYRLDEQGDLNSVVQLDQPSLMAISPDESWLVTLHKKPQRLAQRNGQFVTLRNFVGLERKHFRSVVFQGKLSRSIEANLVQVLAIDRRYIIRVLTSLHTAQSCLECFTRKGKFMGNLPLNVSLASAMLASDPYQIVALSAPDTDRKANLLLISLRPFQVNSVALSTADLRSSPRGIGVFSWGYAVIDDGGCLFLDRSGHSVGRLDLLGVSAIAALPNSRALVAIATPQAIQLQNSSSENTFSNESSLVIIDLKSLNLDLVF